MRVLWDANSALPVKLWADVPATERVVPIEAAAIDQAKRLTLLPFVYRHVAVMPDAHAGRGSTVGTVIPTIGAIIPAAVGVDIGCGMNAVRTGLTASHLPDSLAGIRSAIEKAVPNGRSNNGQSGDVGSWGDGAPMRVISKWATLAAGWEDICSRYPVLRRNAAPESHLGTLGTGNHFVEVCLDEEDGVWIMLHSGSRGPGNRIGSFFIEKAKEEMERWFIRLPDADCAYIPEGSRYFGDYKGALLWAQEFASINRELMMIAALEALRDSLPPSVRHLATSVGFAVSCHHNYVSREQHFGRNVWVTRKGAVSAREGQLGIIPGAMGRESYIVRGLGNPESFNSCSHGAGRLMSRTEARRRFTVEDHVNDTAGVECIKDESVLDETPRAYKPIADVMAAQADLVEPVAKLRAVVCVKGGSER